MSGSKNVIELNGQLYDASTGAIVGQSQAPAQPTIIPPQTKGKALDGFIRKPGSHQAAPVTPKHHTTSSEKPTEHPPIRLAGKHATAHQPHRAKTLMRRGLKKPSLAEPVASTPIIENQPILEMEQAPISSSRLQRAKAVHKSPKISRFGLSLANRHNFVKKTSHVPVRPAPAHSTHHEALVDQRRVVAQRAAVSSKEHNKVLKEKLVAEAIKQARTPEVHHKPAKQHKLAHKLGVSPKTLRFSTGALAILLIAGFFAYQNAADISMRIASNRAGFAATTPGYKPSGFGLSGPVEYGPGQITLNFKSNSDQRNFHITQRVSSWNSEALLSNFVTLNNKSYQTLQDKGRTIYIYDGSNATWVSGGVWYQIEGNSSLTSDQLLHIASSM